MINFGCMKENEIKTETHPLDPFFPDGAQVLMLGSFPPPRSRWKMDFYYPNFQNDMWRIFGLVFFENKDHFLIRQQNNASDKFLEIIKTIDLRTVLHKLPGCKAIVTTGQKATDTLLSLIKTKPPQVGGYVEVVYENRTLRLYRMPSSSRAYPKPLPEKAVAYRNMFKELGICPL